jgi:hypothetical protein
MGGQNSHHPAAPGPRGPRTVWYGWLGIRAQNLWPGLPELWIAGTWRGFATALGFALLLDGVLLTGLIWDEAIGPGTQTLLRLSLAIAWMVGLLANRRFRAARARLAANATIGGAAGDLFPEALAEYLQGNWFVAEQKCRDLIRRKKDDVEARLLLATLLRHVDRRDEARQELKLLEKFDAAAAWQFEIEQERLLLEQAEEDAAEETDATDDEVKTLPMNSAEPIRKAA